MKDDEIIPLLHGLNRPTFFTLDDDFFKPNLRHAQYCLIYLEQYLQERADRGSRARYEAAMADVQDIEPEEYDRLMPN